MPSANRPEWKRRIAAAVTDPRRGVGPACPGCEIACRLPAGPPNLDELVALVGTTEPEALQAASDAFAAGLYERTPSTPEAVPLTAVAHAAQLLADWADEEGQ